MAGTNDNTTHEFDDVELYGGCVISQKAVAEMRKLADEHQLGFYFNPGGGAFIGGGFACQISTCDDVADLAALRAALEHTAKEAGVPFSLSQLIEMAKAVRVSEKQREEQRRSFAYGNTAIENERITRDMVDRQAEELRIKQK